MQLHPRERDTLAKIVARRNLIAASALAYREQGVGKNPRDLFESAFQGMTCTCPICEKDIPPGGGRALRGVVYCAGNCFELGAEVATTILEEDLLGAQATIRSQASQLVRLEQALPEGVTR